MFIKTVNDIIKSDNRYLRYMIILSFAYIPIDVALYFFSEILLASIIIFLVAIPSICSTFSILTDISRNFGKLYAIVFFMVLGFIFSFDFGFIILGLLQLVIIYLIREKISGTGTEGSPRI